MHQLIKIKVPKVFRPTNEIMLFKILGISKKRKINKSDRQTNIDKYKVTTNYLFKLIKSSFIVPTHF